MKRSVVLLAAGTLLVTGLSATPMATAAPEGPAGPTVFVGDVTAEQFGRLQAAGIDRESIATAPGAARGTTRVEVVTDQTSAAKLARQGVRLSEKRVNGQAVSRRMAAEAASGYTVFRSFSEPGGLRDELRAIAREHPDLVKLERIGRSVQGKDILALKVTKNARQVPDGTRPAVLYSSMQHAREWITPEMTRRLLHYYLDNYDTDRTIRRIVDRNELWFLPVANPDGYDFTFTEGNRLWRKNLRDNNGDGAITGIDGVDPNRNFVTKWGYDNEGSSPSLSSETYRGPAPQSEPETRALDRLMRRVGFSYMVNYHSAAELLLYGVGWQVATPTPDDVVYEALLGTDANPAVPGYDPDISAELYTTNGETTEHAHTAYSTLAITPEMSTCETASAVDPNDPFDPADCESVFSFPDSEALVQREFENNIPFAVAVAQSAKNPDRPVSVPGLETPDFVVDSFDVSYGDPQTVAVTARRSLERVRLQYSVDGGPVRTVRVREFAGGDRYGGEEDVYYGEFRGTVRGADVGDDVEVWFTARRSGRGPSRVESEHFTYRVQSDSSAKVLVLAEEDYEGVNPDYPPTVTAPKYAQQYVDALDEAGYDAEVWDVSAQGVPHHLGVLGHFDAVVWYLGDNRLTQDAEDELTDTPFGPFPDSAVAERTQFLTMSVRDYLNEGGKLAYTGETTGYFGFLDSALALGGIYYGLDGAPEADCAVTVDFFSDCLFLSNDFAQYYLGATARSASDGPLRFRGAGDLAGVDAAFGGQAVTDNPLDEAGSFTLTSGVLPPAQFPLFAGSGAGSYAGSGGPGAFEPFAGTGYAAALHVDNSFMRLARTFDLTSVAASAEPALEFALSFNTEPGFDNVIVEAHTVGSDADWTTLPEKGGRSDQNVPDQCEQGFLLDLHPFLENYLTRGDPCQPTGATGEWNRMTGDSGGWQQVAFDLSAFAGKQVEVSISYVTDPSAGGVGVFVDDTRLTAGGVASEAEGFDNGLGAWTVPGAPPGSAANALDFQASPTLVSAAVGTADSVLFGFGIEQVEDPAVRADILRRTLGSLLAG